jgi:hypothetical protein
MMQKAGVTLGKFIMDKEDLDHQASTHFVKYSGAANEDGYPGYHPA